MLAWELIQLLGGGSLCWETLVGRGDGNEKLVDLIIEDLLHE